MTRALIVNDDGYKSAGIRAIISELQDSYDVLAVAPAQEQSWVSKSITRHRLLTTEQVEYFDFKGYAVDGTPADCTQLGMFHLADAIPDFVVSGINIGTNVGYEEILSSGTVGAALEAALQNVPAFAVSISRPQMEIDYNAEKTIEQFRAAAGIACKIIDKVMAAGFPLNTHVVCINMPWDVAAEAPWVITKPHTSRFEELFQENDGKFKHRGSIGLREQAADNSDLAAIKKGCVSIVPLNLQLTSDGNQESLSRVLNAPIFIK